MIFIMAERLYKIYPIKINRLKTLYIFTSWDDNACTEDVLKACRAFRVCAERFGRFG